MVQQTQSVLPGTLVDTIWLQDHLDAPTLRVIDIRGYVRSEDLGGGRQRAVYEGAQNEYAAGHIPGSVFVDWTTDITDPGNPVKVQIASPERFARAMELRGVGNDTDVVIVDHAGGHFATRLWWALRYYGHDRAAVLDGGFNRWAAEGRPLTMEASLVVPSTFVAEPRTDLRVEPPAILATIADHEAQIVDARDPGQYDGSVVRGKRGGHIPTAVNLPSAALFASDGLWKTPDQLRELFASSELDPARPVIAYCNGGVTATSLLFALDRVGFGNWANYDGSWNEWGDREDLPVETGQGSEG